MTIPFACVSGAGKKGFRCGCSCLGRAVHALFFFMLLTPVAALAQEMDEAPERPTQAPAQTEEEVIQRYFLWPLVSVEESPEWRQFAARPLYVERTHKDQSRKRVQVLWPLYVFRRDGKDVTIRIFPLFTYWRDVYEFMNEDESNMQYMLFPIIFRGKSTEAGDYFALFPVGGKLKHFLGRDEIVFVLFPLYFSYQKGELRQRNYVWPVLSFSGGGDYSGFRLWPLYGQFQKEGEYRSEFILWPIYNHQEYDLDKEQPGERLLIFPLYAREDNRRRHFRAYLWPFFTFEENFAANFTERATPWPFVVRTQGENVDRRQFWPLYGRVTTEDSETQFIAWPLWHRRADEAEGDPKTIQKSLMPFYASTTKFSPETNEVMFQKTRVWPLWRSFRYEDGSSYSRALSLLWFDDVQGFERQYSPLWTVYERAETPDGETRTYALWRLFQRVETPGKTKINIPLLYNYQQNLEQDTEHVKILGGLFGTSREGNQRDFQVLYLLRTHGETVLGEGDATIR
ncbi:MAG: hypothetical protein C4520_03110 [Candidatus Abyssobacteria bacterium SURF_5]|uniref:Uncharacterized protein n=1 Tax=Abyssobacteria bacterium (strain SURF_5) TaxID=2093360 RepID=A0A3A4PAJ2_ABYX5|nr:MAG: hypothetical protein C4520_03110 [Candidatus Abyssubacteria bacterium SURF_5]